LETIYNCLQLKSTIMSNSYSSSVYSLVQVFKAWRQTNSLKVKTFNLSDMNGCYVVSTVIVLIGCIISILPYVIHDTDVTHDVGALETDDSSEYLVDFSSLLETNWASFHLASRSEDILGWHSSIVGTSVASTRNLQNESAFIRQQVITYSSRDNARKRYLAQQERVFVYNYGVPPQRQRFPYKSITFDTDTNPNAEKYYIGCKDIYDNFQEDKLIDVSCGGIFLYGNHVVFLDIDLMGDDYIIYLTEGDLVNIFSAVDEKMIDPDIFPLSW
jgi:hypothetical protein